MNQQDELNRLVSVHLGRAGDGTVVKPYVTPDAVDSNLLVSVPRHLNRVGYGLHDDDLPFVGEDAWNAYEFSTLLKNGFPVTGWLKITVDAHSPNIVESKSVKLYLNSFNMARLIDKLDDIYIIEDQIAQDIRNATGGQAFAMIAGGKVDTVPAMKGGYTSLEEYLPVEEMVFDQYHESPEILEVIPSTRRFEYWHSNSLRSNCRVTNQPDWGDVFVVIKGNKTVTPESLLKYIISMRRENHFHEEICELIYKRLWDIIGGGSNELLVACLYTRRGGIDINPVRASSTDLLFNFTNLTNSWSFCEKTDRQ